MMQLKQARLRSTYVKRILTIVTFQKKLLAIQQKDVSILFLNVLRYKLRGFGQFKKRKNS